MPRSGRAAGDRPAVPTPKVLAAAPKLKDRRARRRQAETTSTWTPRRPAACWWSAPRRRTSTAPRYALALLLAASRQIPAARRVAASTEAFVIFRYRDLQQNRRPWWVWARSGGGRPADRCVRRLRRRHDPYVSPARAQRGHQLCCPDACWPAPISSRCTEHQNGRTDRQRRWRRPSQASSSSTPRAFGFGGPGGRPTRDHRQPRCSGRCGRVRHRTVHRQPAVRAGTGGEVTPHLERPPRRGDRAGTDVAELRPSPNVVTRSVGGRWSTRRWRPLAVVAPAGVLVCCRRAAGVVVGVQVRTSWPPERLSAAPRTGAARPVLGGDRGCGDICQRRHWPPNVASPPRSQGLESPNHRSVVDVRAIGADGSVLIVSGTLAWPTAVAEDRADQRPPLICAPGDQPDASTTSRPAGERWADRHIAKRDGRGNVGRAALQTPSPGATTILQLDQRHVPDACRTRDRSGGRLQARVVDLS